jgi:hypothetical protein
MSKFTQRNTDQSTCHTWGSITVSPIDDVFVGTHSTWTIKFTVGAYAMDVGGGLKIGTRRQADFGQAQFDDPKAENYASVTCSRPGTKLNAWFDHRGHQRPFNAVIAIRILEGPLYPGDSISIVLGDTSKGSSGLKVQSFPESECDFAVFVDPISSGVYKRVYNHAPMFQVLSGPSEYLTIVAPSIVKDGEQFRIQVRGNDKYGNPTPVDSGSLNLDADPAVKCALTIADGRAKWFDGVTLKGIGVRRLSISSGKKVLAVSNPIIVQDQSDEEIYWGDTQAQTASTVGIGTPDEYFAYARDYAAIDFASHQGNDWILSDADYAEVKQASKKYHKPGSFIPYFGYEWSGPTGAGGDRNVLYLDDDGPIFRSNHWQLQHDEFQGDPAETECVSATDLQERIRAYIKETGRKAILLPHIGGRKSDYLVQAPDIEPVFEICSNHGIFEWRLFEFLQTDKRIGVVGASDDHTCRPGLAYPSTPEMTILGGLGAVFAKEKTREGIYDGLMSRHCYATTGARIVLFADADGHPMGSEFSAKAPPKLHCQIYGTAPIDEIQIFNREQEIHRIEPNPPKRDKKRVRIIWTGANTQDRGRFMSWHGGLDLEGGRIVSAEPLNMYSAKYGITETTDTHVEWLSVTSGQEEGVLLELDAPDDAQIKFNAGPAQFSISLADVRNGDINQSFGGLDQTVSASTMHCEGDICDFTINDVVEENLEPGSHAYFIRVVQRDFHRAWSSPIYVDYEK